MKNLSVKITAMAFDHNASANTAVLYHEMARTGQSVPASMAHQSKDLDLWGPKRSELSLTKVVTELVRVTDIEEKEAVFGNPKKPDHRMLCTFFRIAGENFENGTEKYFCVPVSKKDFVKAINNGDEPTVRPLPRRVLELTANY